MLSALHFLLYLLTGGLQHLLQASFVPHWDLMRLLIHQSLYRSIQYYSSHHFHRNSSCFPLGD